MTEEETAFLPDPRFPKNDYSDKRSNFFFTSLGRPFPFKLPYLLSSTSANLRKRERLHFL
jgi:hypothetical protein